jgi:hypothetical protein
MSVRASNRKQVDGGRHVHSAFVGIPVRPVRLAKEHSHSTPQTCQYSNPWLKAARALAINDAWLIAVLMPLS